jgi:hypothetical protein
MAAVEKPRTLEAMLVEILPNLVVVHGYAKLLANVVNDPSSITVEELVIALVIGCSLGAQ